MNTIRINVEDAGLDILLIALRFPAFADNRLVRTLYAVLSLEWVNRQTTGEKGKPIELPRILDATDQELLELAGLMHGVCLIIDPAEFLDSFAFCSAFLQIAAAELESRETISETVH